ncbi:hypothetical protein ACTMTI_52530 [Nonomuraea sp. H19]|uniref:hypothetical protein n=1 Tax=Nonomuraea sp. H19 TaxID=3452206 RepID=UPI003F8AA4E6
MIVRRAYARLRLRLAAASPPISGTYARAGAAVSPPISPSGWAAKAIRSPWQGRMV